jgi:hypothetical protein
MPSKRDVLLVSRDEVLAVAAYVVLGVGGAEVVITTVFGVPARPVVRVPLHRSEAFSRSCGQPHHLVGPHGADRTEPRGTSPEHALVGARPMGLRLLRG